jgi:uncharacterized repeat protein (TIGR01451 family)
MKEFQKGAMSMKQWIWAIVAMMALVATAGQAFAAGTIAGTDITNKATAHYTVGASVFSVDSNVNTLKVAELVGLTLTWQDAAPGVTVSQGDTSRVTTYKLTNTGNGTETFGLTKADAGITGDNFDPAVTAVYLDANANGVYDAGTDTLYAAGTNDPTLGPDASTTIFLLSSIPGTGLSDGDKGNVQLTAASKTGTGAPGTVFAGKGDGTPPTDAVIGTSGGTQIATGTYVAASVVVAVNKTATVTDQFGGTHPVPGATILYTITVTVTGSGTAMGVSITDPIPTNTTYTPGTLKLGGAPLTDAVDGDKGDVGGTTAGTMTVGLDNLTSASGPKVITFDVKIN